MILVRHYFPGVDIDSLDDEEFAIIVNDADWMHSQTIVTKQANTLGLMSQ